MDQVIPEVKEISKFQFVFIGTATPFFQKKKIVFTVPNTTHTECVCILKKYKNEKFYKVQNDGLCR